MRILRIIGLLLFGASAHAVDLTWNGLYRVEAVSIQNSQLNYDTATNKSYLLNHLILSPKIVAADGLTLYARFDILNDVNYPATAMGEFWGGQPATGGSSGASGSAVNSNTQNNNWVQISSAYAKWASEYGALFVGRVPIQFGLGITYSAGLGDFDHYYDTKDMVGYKITAGNLYFMPMYARVKQGDIQFAANIDDYMAQVEYDNPDTETNLGIFYEVRVATKNANDAVFGNFGYGGPGSTLTGSFQRKTLNVYVQRVLGNFHFGFESSFQNGQTGIQDASGAGVNISAYALVGEFGWTPQSKWSFDLKTGLVTGDDPNTTNTFEGYFVNRNYDIGFLLFNQVLGGSVFGNGATGNLAYDVLGSKGFRNGDKGATDVEYLTNTLYAAPGAKLQMSDAWNLNTRVIWAQLQRSELVPSQGISNSLGVEWDLGIGYKPHERFTLEAGAGFFWPGDAFRGGTLNLPWDFAYGFQTRAAVRF